MLSKLLYKAGIALYGAAAKVLALAGKEKPKAFVEGRINLFKELSQQRAGISKPIVWFHCSSLGEFEQARPLIEDINRHHKKYAVLLSFFSPSGYEQRKDYAAADIVSYLPLDTAANAKLWLGIVQPSIALFAKYDLWYYMLRELRRENVPTLLFSAVFRPSQIFFKPYGSLHRKMLSFFTQVFVQDEASEALLRSIGIQQVAIAGDTRIDSVAAMAKNPKAVPEAAIMASDAALLIAGSTWPPDLELLRGAFSALKESWKLVIAPHDVSKNSIQHTLSACAGYRVATLSSKPDAALLQILIIDSIGLLGNSYQYGTAAFVGGGFETGLHSTLEPAAYGLPVFFGPHYQKFVEAVGLIADGGAASVRTSNQLLHFLRNKSKLQPMGKISGHYIAKHQGATRQILHYLFSEKYLSTAP